MATHVQHTELRSSANHSVQKPVPTELTTVKLNQHDLQQKLIGSFPTHDSAARKKKTRELLAAARSLDIIPSTLPKFESNCQSKYDMLPIERFYTGMEDSMLGRLSNGGSISDG